MQLMSLKKPLAAAGPATPCMQRHTCGDGACTGSVSLWYSAAGLSCVRTCAGMRRGSIRHGRSVMTVRGACTAHAASLRMATWVRHVCVGQRHDGMAWWPGPLLGRSHAWHGGPEQCPVGACMPRMTVHAFGHMPPQQTREVRKGRVQHHAACMHAGSAMSTAHLPLQDHPPHDAAQRPQPQARPSRAWRGREGWWGWWAWRRWGCSQ